MSLNSRLGSHKEDGEEELGNRPRTVCQSENDAGVRGLCHSATGYAAEKNTTQRDLRLIDFVYHSTLGLRVIKKKKGAGETARTASLT